MGLAAAEALAAAADPVVVAAGLASRPNSRIELLGAPLHQIDRDGVDRLLLEQLSQGACSLVHVVTLNPEYVMAARNSETFAQALERAEVSVADGAGVVIAARLLAGCRVARVTGVDLVSSILHRDQYASARVFLLGSPASVASLQGQFPTRIVGRWGSGTAGSADDAESIGRIRERNANVVLVGYGAPGQVLWIERNRNALASAGIRIAIGVGGALDYLAGESPRAPVVLRRIGLEWAYRLWREPWRWRRQLALPRFACLTLLTWLRQLRKE